MLDALGRASVYGDLYKPETLAGKAADWWFATPWWVPAGLATIATIVWLIFMFRPSLLGAHAPGSWASDHQSDSPKRDILHVTEEQWNLPLERVFRRTFLHETVTVDGIDFVECSFDQVTLNYQGRRPFRFTNSDLTKDKNGYRVTISSENPVIQNVLFYFYAMNTQKSLDIRRQ